MIKICKLNERNYALCDVEMMTVLLQQLGVQIPSGYGNNDETMLGSLSIGTQCTFQKIWQAAVARNA